MDKLQKLLRKIAVKDRESLLALVTRLSDRDKSLKAVKIKNSDFFRVRSGNFRVIFHLEKGEVIIDGIRLRNDHTYKNL